MESAEMEWITCCESSEQVWNLITLTVVNSIDGVFGIFGLVFYLGFIFSWLIVYFFFFASYLQILSAKRKRINKWLKYTDSKNRLTPIFWAMKFFTVLLQETMKPFLISLSLNLSFWRVDFFSSLCLSWKYFNMQKCR